MTVRKFRNCGIGFVLLGWALAIFHSDFTGGGAETLPIAIASVVLFVCGFFAIAVWLILGFVGIGLFVLGWYWMHGPIWAGIIIAAINFVGGGWVIHQAFSVKK